MGIEGDRGGADCWACCGRAGVVGVRGERGWFGLGSGSSGSTLLCTSRFNGVTRASDVCFLSVVWGQLVGEGQRSQPPCDRAVGLMISSSNDSRLSYMGASSMMLASDRPSRLSVVETEVEMVDAVEVDASKKLVGREALPPELTTQMFWLEAGADGGPESSNGIGDAKSSDDKSLANGCAELSGE